MLDGYMLRMQDGEDLGIGGETVAARLKALQLQHSLTIPTAWAADSVESGVAAAGSWLFQTTADSLLLDLTHCHWTARHGAAAGLCAIIRHQGSRAGTVASPAGETLCSRQIRACDPTQSAAQVAYDAA